MILAHNYQVPEIQDVADFIGDSLGLSREAAATDAEVIVFCGVHFMAETASILSPGEDRADPRPRRRLLAVRLDHRRPAREWKAEHPGAVVVMYVNTSAEVKAETDYCCTSSNAVQVVEHIWREHGAETEILFGPDMWLAPSSPARRGSPTTPSATRASTSGTASATSTPGSAPRTSPAPAPSIPAPSS